MQAHSAVSARNLERAEAQLRNALAVVERINREQAKPVAGVTRIVWRSHGTTRRHAFVEESGHVSAAAMCGLVASVGTRGKWKPSAAPCCKRCEASR